MSSIERNGQKDFWPDDTPTCFYVEGHIGLDLEDLKERALLNWPQAKISEIQVSAEYIQTRSLGTKLYDPADYRAFVVVTYNKAK